MLLVCTPNPDTVAETFVRQHIRLIQPGETAVAYFDGSGSKVSTLPSIKLPYEDLNVFDRTINTIVRGYPGSLVGESSEAFQNFVSRHGVTAVLAEQGQVGCRVMSSCRALGLPLHVYFHGHDATAYPDSVMRKYYYRRLASVVNGVFVGSKYMADRVSEIGFEPSQISVEPSGIETSVFVPSAQRDPNLVVAVGRFVEKKAPHLTVRAFAQSLQEFPDARLEMVGDGELMGLVRNEVERLHLKNKVTLHGAQPHDFVMRLVPKASVFLQHSVTAPNGDMESCGISLLEAMASAVPVVSTLHNGFSETVAEGVTGRLVREHDVDAMSRRLCEFLGNRDMVEKMGRAGRERVQAHFDAERIARSMRATIFSRVSPARESNRG